MWKYKNCQPKILYLAMLFLWGRNKGWEDSLPLNISCCRRQWQPTPLLLPGKSHARRSLVGCSPWGREESDTTERIHFHVSLSCIGQGNGNPLQCSCLENPRDGGAWWAAVYGVAQSWTRLKWLSSSSSSSLFTLHQRNRISIKKKSKQTCLAFTITLRAKWQTGKN